MLNRRLLPNFVSKWVKSAYFKSLLKWVDSVTFSKIYLVFALVVLVGTTLYWSTLGALLHQNNADQLVNSYLFENSATFHGAQFPAAHTFLIKWPLFLLIRAFGYSSATFAVFTVIVTLLTITFLLTLLYRIERRPLVFGTICLALASVLLLVPAQPYAGGVLPVNMAMLATRNLEYIFYVISLALLIRSPRLRSWSFWLGVGLLSLLIASDKLFLSLSVGGALIALVVYALSKGWNLVSLSVNWLVASLIAGLGGLSLLWLINKSSLTHIASQSGLSPYGLIDNTHTILVGIKYAILNLFTNFGANPAFDASSLNNISHQLHVRLIGLAGVAFVINTVILTCGLVIAVKLIISSLAHNKNRKAELANSARLSILLIWTSLAAGIIFVASNHFYPVDARYLTISLFTLFIAAAAYASTRQWRSRWLALTGVILTISLIFGIIGAFRIYSNEKIPLTAIKARDTLIYQALAQHPVKVLVGDYWRVIPTKTSGPTRINVLPLADCTQPRANLSSKNWQVDLNKQSFAYILSLDKSLTDFPKCSLQQVINSYGRPNSSVVIAGNFASPKEILLFYDHGAHKSSPKLLLKTPSTVLPIQLDELPYTSCPVPSVMNIVAHQDDDLLFMSPDLLHDIHDGHCIRTIYVTAGDAGSGQFYWLKREQGSEAAYSNMVGQDDLWIDRVVQLPGGQFITVANPRGNSRISLIFMHLPDGNIRGQGFNATRYESVEKLDRNKISSIHSIYSDSAFTPDQLQSALADLMHLYQPAEIRTQANFTGNTYSDHSDHMAVGRFAQRAYQQYESQQFEGRITIPLKFYIGYPIHAMLPNVTGDDLNQKVAAFASYAHFDGGVCVEACSRNSVYGIYLTRQYQSPH